MKKLLALCGSIATMLLFTPLTILAAESGESSTATVPVWLCIPFAGLLLCIAVLPLVKPEWWEKNQPLAVAAWSLLFIIPFAVTYSAGDAVETVLECILNDYLTFIVLLFGLFCVAGNITLEGDLAGSPRVNVIFLAIGTLLSSCIGTTGASMLMVFSNRSRCVRELPLWGIVRCGAALWRIPLGKCLLVLSGCSRNSGSPHYLNKSGLSPASHSVSSAKERNRGILDALPSGIIYLYI